ncbi:MAG: RNA polymerase sigma factor, partial [Polyangiaceae bacterium]
AAKRVEKYVMSKQGMGLAFVTPSIGITPSFARRLRKTRHVLATTFAAKGSGWDGDDVIQEVLIALARRAPKLEPWPQQKLDRYAKRAFLRRLSNARRREQRSRLRDGAWAYDREPAIQMAEGLTTEAPRSTLCESLLALLPEDIREVVIARELEGLTIQETASTLGIGEGAVRFRLRLGRGLLKKLGAQIAGAALKTLSKENPCATKP